MTKRLPRITLCQRTGCHHLLPVDTPSRIRYCGKRCADAQWKVEHREERNAAARAWASANPEKRREIQARYAETHAEEIAKARREARASGRYTETYRAWRATARGQVVMRNHTLRARYGIEVEQYDLMLREQGGHCRLCPRTPEDEGRALAVDHDHACCPGRKSCGRCLRGLLCTSCNNRLAAVENPDEEWIATARAYLAEARTVGDAKPYLMKTSGPSERRLGVSVAGCC